MKTAMNTSIPTIYIMPVSLYEVIRVVIQTLCQTPTGEQAEDLIACPFDAKRHGERKVYSFVRDGNTSRQFRHELSILLNEYGPGKGRTISWRIADVPPACLELDNGPFRFRQILVAEYAPKATLRRAIEESDVILTRFDSERSIANLKYRKLRPGSRHGSNEDRVEQPQGNG